jgi:hypothetical protein
MTADRSGDTNGLTHRHRDKTIETENNRKIGGQYKKWKRIERQNIQLTKGRNYFSCHPCHGERPAEFVKLLSGWTNRLNKFLAAGLNICVPSVWNALHFTLLVSRDFLRLLPRFYFWTENCAPLHLVIFHSRGGEGKSKY